MLLACTDTWVCDDKEQAKVDMVEQQLADLQQGFVIMVLSKSADAAAARANYFEKTVPMHLELLSKFLGDRKYLVGDRLTYVDFYLFELLTVLNQIEPGAYNSYANFKSFAERISSLPRLKEYLVKYQPIRDNANPALLPLLKKP